MYDSILLLPPASSTILCCWCCRKSSRSDAIIQSYVLCSGIEMVRVCFLFCDWLVIDWCTTKLTSIYTLRVQDVPTTSSFSLRTNRRIECCDSPPFQFFMVGNYHGTQNRKCSTLVLLLLLLLLLQYCISSQDIHVLYRVRLRRRRTNKKKNLQFRQ